MKEIDNDSEKEEGQSEISKFEKSEKFNKIIDAIKDFFTCKSCKHLISNSSICEKCLSFFCKNCGDLFAECPLCMASPYKSTINEDLNYVISNLFSNGKIIQGNINFTILLAADLNSLYKENKIKNIIKGEDEDYESFSSELRVSMIENLAEISFSSDFDTLEETFSYTNLLDVISKESKLMNDKINETKKNNPEKFIDIETALSKPPNSDLFISGIMAKYLINEGINVAIEKESSEAVKSSVMNWLVTGIYKSKIISLHFDFGKEMNNLILTNKKLKENFIKTYISVISEKIKVNYQDLHFMSMSKGSVSLNLSTVESFDEISLDELQREYNEIKDISYKLLLEGCLISRELFDTRWNNRDGGWAKKGEMRGGRNYDPPIGWLGYGLKVSNKYDEGDNTWLGMENKKGEWWVAYHGTARWENDNKKKLTIPKNIIEEGFKVGANQVHESFHNINELSNNKYSTVGRGVYLTDQIDIAKRYSGIFEYDNHRYNLVFMCRVCPEEVRISEYQKNYFVVNPSDNCVRPYRILLKEINANSKCILF